MSTGSLKNRAVTLAPTSFEKPFFGDFDFHFLILFLCCLVLEGVVVYSLSRRPVSEFSDKEISRIQERFAQFILKEERTADDSRNTFASGEAQGGEEETAEEAVAAEETSGGSGGEDNGESRTAVAEVRHANRRADASARRAEMSRQVSSKGLLGLLTASGGSQGSGSVTDVLGSVGRGGGSDLDEVLASSDGLKTTGRSTLAGGDGTGTGARGGRTGQQGATIDDLVTERGSAGSQSLSRSGELQVETPADVAGRGHGSVYRSGQELQRVIYDHYSAIKYCYERELKRHPTLKGKVTVRITVNADGEVADAEIVNSTLNNERVERCIITRIKRWNDFKPIDRSEGDVTFTQVFNFGY